MERCEITLGRDYVSSGVGPYAEVNIAGHVSVDQVSDLYNSPGQGPHTILPTPNNGWVIGVEKRTDMDGTNPQFRATVIGSSGVEEVSVTGDDTADILEKIQEIMERLP